MGQYGGTCAKSNILCLLNCGFIMGKQVYEQPGAEGVEVEMTKEELQQLILIMGTITVISFILVITLSSIIIVFIWYGFTLIRIFYLIIPLMFYTNNSL